MTLTIQSFLKLVWFYVLDPDYIKINFYFEGYECKVSTTNIHNNITVTSIHELETQYQGILSFEITDRDLHRILELIYAYVEDNIQLEDVKENIWNKQITFAPNRFDLKIEIEDDLREESCIMNSRKSNTDTYEPIITISANDWEKITSLAFLTLETQDSNILPLPSMDAYSYLSFSSIGSKVFVSGHDSNVFFKDKYQNLCPEVDSYSILIPNIAIAATTKYEVCEEVKISYSEAESSIKLSTSKYEIVFPYELNDDYSLGNMLAQLDKYKILDAPIPLPQEYLKINSTTIELIRDNEDPFAPNYSLAPLATGETSCQLPGAMWSDCLSFFPQDSKLSYNLYCLGKDDYLISLHHSDSNLTIVVTTYKRDRYFGEKNGIKINNLSLHYLYCPKLFPYWDIFKRKTMFDGLTDPSFNWSKTLNQIANDINIKQLDLDMARVRREFDNLNSANSRTLPSNEDYHDALHEFESIRSDSKLKETPLSEQLACRNSSPSEFNDFEELIEKIYPAIDQIEDDCRYLKTLIFLN